MPMRANRFGNRMLAKAKRYIILPNVPNFFEDNQLVTKDKQGKHISSFSMTCVQLPGKKRPPKDAVKARRINISSDITFGPVWIMPDFRPYDIPDVFGYPFQFTFIDQNKHVYITNDVNVALVDL